jgi:glycerophosphoryl diester phosphodiesterase
MIFISHRGASKDLPENTVPAFLLAKKAGFEYFETDVQLTKDNILVSCHDYNLKRTAGVDIEVSELTFDELEKFNVANYFKGHEKKLTVPCLSEVFDCLGSDAKICLEIKNRDNRYPQIHKEILKFISGCGKCRKNIFLSSFHYETLVKIRQLDSGISIGVLAKKGETAGLIDKALAVGAVSLNIHFSDAKKNLIGIAKCKNLKVLAYTVNDISLAEKMKNVGIDGIFTDRIDLNRL